jgi:hypothetical protein
VEVGVAACRVQELLCRQSLERHSSFLTVVLLCAGHTDCHKGPERLLSLVTELAGLFFTWQFFLGLK